MDKNTGLTTIILLIGLSSLISQVISQRGRRGINTELTIYEGLNGTGASLEYSEYMDLFDDLELLLRDQKLTGLEWICVTAGVFILYEQADHYIDDADEVRLLSGLNKCTVPPSFGVGSVRHAASKWLNFETNDLITLFSELYYVFHMYTVLTRSKREIERSQPTQSMIIVGSTQWLIENQAGEKFCLTAFRLEDDNEITKDPTSPKPLYICIVPNTTDLFDKGNGDSDIYLTQISKDCLLADAAVTQLQVDTCFDYASGELQQAAVNPIVITKEPKKTMTTDEGSESSPFFGLECKGPYDEIALLIRMRVTSDFVDTYQFLLPLDKQHTWRTELLDATFEVVTKLVGTIVPAWFLGSVREFFIYFSEKNVWSDGKGWPEDKPNKEVLTALHETKKCYEKAGPWSLLRSIQTTVEDLVEAGPINDDAVKEELQLNKEYDPLTEFIWLSINLVGVTCHQILKFMTNYWLDYLTTSSNMYLKPMVDYWRFGDSDEQKYYPIIFGGLNFTRQYETVAVFASTVYDLMKYSEIYSRPEELKTVGNSSSGGDETTTEAAGPAIEPATVNSI